MSLFSPPSLHSSLAVLVLNRCIHSVKSSLEGLPAAYWFIINEIRTFVCQEGFCPIVGWIVACQEDLLYYRRGHWRNKEEQRTYMVFHCQGHCDFHKQTLKKVNKLVGAISVKQQYKACCSPEFAHRPDRSLIIHLYAVWERKKKAFQTAGCLCLQSMLL